MAQGFRYHYRIDFTRGIEEDSALNLLKYLALKLEGKCEIILDKHDRVTYRAKPLIEKRKKKSKSLEDIEEIQKPRTIGGIIARNEALVSPAFMLEERCLDSEQKYFGIMLYFGDVDYFQINDGDKKFAKDIKKIIADYLRQK